MLKIILSSLCLLTAIETQAAPSAPVSTFHAKLNFELFQEHIRSEVLECSSGNAAVMKMYDEMVDQWFTCYRETSIGAADLQALLAATSFAAKKHQGQVRKDTAATPYIIHPMGVARSLWEEGGVRSANVLVAALLHDTLEDTKTTAEEIESLFGPRVRATVEELTNDPNLTTEQNKERQVSHAHEMSLNAQLVKLSDRLYNIRDLRNPPPSWSEEKVQNYLWWGSNLLSALKGVNPAMETALLNEINTLSKP